MQRSTIARNDSMTQNLRDCERFLQAILYYFVALGTAWQYNKRVTESLQSRYSAEQDY